MFYIIFFILILGGNLLAYDRNTFKKLLVKKTKKNTTNCIFTSKTKGIVYMIINTDN